jgi:hypothetical protein
MKFLAGLLIGLILLVINPKLVNAIVDPLTSSNNIFGMSVVNQSDLDDVSTLVNSNGGQWGYIKIVIQENNRNKEIWQNFLDEARRKKLIPIIRVATVYNSEKKYWEKPKTEDIDNWVNFLNSLNWVTTNRYVIVANEPNHSKEWGGKIEPEEYAKYLKEFSTRLKNSNSDYFVLNAGLDQSANNSKITMDEKLFLQRMVKYEPSIFNYIDGFNSHSYPNPDFSGKVTDTGKGSIKGYLWEKNYLNSLGVNMDLPIFITETGWINKTDNEQLIAENYKYAYEEVWMKDNSIVAVTPFILNYLEEPFKNFSWKKDDNNFFEVYEEIKNLNKIEGHPSQKIEGQILFNFLNPFGFRNTKAGGIILVKNTGEAIWYENQIRVEDENKKVNIVDIRMKNIEPYKTGLIAYSLIHPQNERISKINLGFYILEEKMGDIFNGKIISF